MAFELQGQCVVHSRTQDHGYFQIPESWVLFPNRQRAGNQATHGEDQRNGYRQRLHDRRVTHHAHTENQEKHKFARNNV